jgi:hypothetical protein
MRRSPYWPHLYVVKEDGEPALRMWALSFLIEDRTDGLPSYREYLETLRNKVRSHIQSCVRCRKLVLTSPCVFTGQFGLIQLETSTAMRDKLVWR